MTSRQLSISAADAWLSSSPIKGSFSLVVLLKQCLTPGQDLTPCLFYRPGMCHLFLLLWTPTPSILQEFSRQNSGRYSLQTHIYGHFCSDNLKQGLPWRFSGCLGPCFLLLMPIKGNCHCASWELSCCPLGSIKDDSGRTITSSSKFFLSFFTWKHGLDNHTILEIGPASNVQNVGVNLWAGTPRIQPGEFCDLDRVWPCLLLTPVMFSVLGPGLSLASTVGFAFGCLLSSYYILIYFGLILLGESCLEQDTLVYNEIST